VRKAHARATARTRVLPDFLIIGAQKAGTSALHAYLDQHSAVGTGSHKEIHYFTLYAQRSLEWYRSHFPTQSGMERLGARTRVGESTPYYLFHPAAPERARRVLPDARLIVLLRNPVDRAHSHHNHEVAQGFESLGFEEALEAEPGRLAGLEERLLADPTAVSHEHRHFSYFARGSYAEQLERWFACYPAERFLVLFSEDLFADPVGTTIRAQQFLGLEPEPPADVKPVNARSYAGLDAAMRERLGARFAAPNRRLADLLERDLPWA
jgi:hypothetical protein